MKKVSIGERIKKIRIERGLTQAQLGSLCVPEMKDSAIRRYESGKVIPKTKTLQRIAKALNVSIADLDPDTYFWNATGQEIIDLFTGCSNILPLHTGYTKESSGYYGTVSNQVNDEKLEIELESGDEIILNYFHDMNDSGKDKVIDYAADIVENPKYKKDPDDKCQE